MVKANQMTTTKRMKSPPSGSEKVKKNIHDKITHITLTLEERLFRPRVISFVYIDVKHCYQNKYSLCHL